MRQTGLFLHIMSAEVQGWVAGRKLFYLCAGVAAGVFIGPWFISFTFGSDETIFSDVVLSSLWVLVIGATVVLASTSAAEDMEAERITLCRAAGATNGSIVAAKLLAALFGSLLLWEAGTAVILGVAANEPWVKAAAVGTGAAVLLLSLVPWIARRPLLLVLSVLAIGAAESLTLFAELAGVAAGSVAEVFPVSAGLGFVAVLMGLTLPLPVALTVSVGVWVMLFAVEAALGAGGPGGAAAGLPVLNIPEEAWKSMSGAESIVVLAALCASAACIMLLAWAWGTRALSKGES